MELKLLTWGCLRETGNRLHSGYLVTIDPSIIDQTIKPSADDVVLADSSRRYLSLVIEQPRCAADFKRLHVKLLAELRNALR